MRFVLAVALLPGAAALVSGTEASVSERFNTLHFAHRTALRTAAARVAERLGWVLADRGISQEEMAQAARSRLQQEAARLQRGSELMRRYAETAPDGLLVAPIYQSHFQPNMIPGILNQLATKGFDFADRLAQADGANETSHSEVTTETIVQNGDAEGKMIKETTRCVNGQCETLQEEGPPASAPGHLDDGLSKEVKHLAETMLSSESTFDEDGFKEVLGDAFRDHRSWLHFPAPRWGVDLPMPSDTDDLSQGSNWGADRAMGMLGNLVRGVTGRSATSESTETSVRDGMLVRKTQHCQDGQCWTAIQESPLEGNFEEERVEDVQDAQ